MKGPIKVYFAFVLSTVTSCVCASTNSPGFASEMEKYSYAIGMQLGQTYKSLEFQVDLNALMQGLKDVLHSNETRLTEQEMRETLMQAQQLVVSNREFKLKALAKENKEKADRFLAENKQKPGIVTLPSGLQYKIIKEGQGSPPGPEDIVTVNYVGRLLDGTEFDSSFKRGRPASFPLTGVIPGWREALQLMKPGSKWELYIPPELAYGERGRPNIPPNSLLIFEVELISNTPPVKAESSPSLPERKQLTSDIIKVPSMEEMKRGAKIEIIKAEELEKLTNRATDK